MTEGKSKTRFHNHEPSFRNKKYASSTALSKFIWELKEKDVNYSIKWSILKVQVPEKFFILNAGTNYLNKRTELLTKCQHKNTFYVNSIKPP